MIGTIPRYGEGRPFPAGTVLLIEFTPDGRRFHALNGGPEFWFSEAISLSVPCADQADLDRYWAALTAGGGSVRLVEGPVRCFVADRAGGAGSHAEGRDD